MLPFTMPPCKTCFRLTCRAPPQAHLGVSLQQPAHQVPPRGRQGQVRGELEAGVRQAGAPGAHGFVGVRHSKRQAAGHHEVQGHPERPRVRGRAPLIEALEQHLREERAGQLLNGDKGHEVAIIQPSLFTSMTGAP